MKIFVISLIVFFLSVGHAFSATKWIATFYTIKSCKKEGTIGTHTASGERYDENKFTCALRSRKFGLEYKVTNIKNGRSVIVRHNDFGPGHGPKKRGVIIDLTPRAFDVLGGKRGNSWGEIKVKVERIALNRKGGDSVMAGKSKGKKTSKKSSSMKMGKGY